MKIIDLLENHSTETSCKEAFKAHREAGGLTCKKCQSKEQKWNANKNLWQCCGCGFRMTLRSGTVLQHTKMPFKIWFQVVALMISTKKGFSAKEVQAQVNHKRYEPVWYMMHKIRTRMGKSIESFDELEKLMVSSIPGIQLSLDDSNYCVVSKEVQIEAKHANRSDSINLKNKKQTIKMRAIKSELESWLEFSVTRKPINQTFGVDFKRINSNGMLGRSEKLSILATKCLANVKRILYEIHHQVKSEYLQNYLDEFCYKFNNQRSTEVEYEELWRRLIIPPG